MRARASRCLSPSTTNVNGGEYRIAVESKICTIVDDHGRTHFSSMRGLFFLPVEIESRQLSCAEANGKSRDDLRGRREEIARVQLAREFRSQ